MRYAIIEQDRLFGGLLRVLDNTNAGWPRQPSLFADRLLIKIAARRFRIVCAVTPVAVAIPLTVLPEGQPPEDLSTESTATQDVAGRSPRRRVPSMSRRVLPKAGCCIARRGLPY